MLPTQADTLVFETHKLCRPLVIPAPDPVAQPCLRPAVLSIACVRKIVIDLGRTTMAPKTITRAHLCEAVYKKGGLSRMESVTLVELVLQEITDCLMRGEAVKLSAFGSFVVRKSRPRTGRNPKTGKKVPIPARRVMVFKPSAVLTGRINSRR